MLDRPRSNEGFTLVEVVIAMLLLGLIAIAMLPALWNGIRFSTEQSAVATATREVNTLIEQARQTALRPSANICGDLQAYANADSTRTDGTGIHYTTEGILKGCLAAGGSTASLEIWATQGGRELVRVKAMIYVIKASS